MRGLCSMLCRQASIHKPGDDLSSCRALNLPVTSCRTYTAVSGIAAIGIALGFQNIKTKEGMFGAVTLYLTMVAAAFFAFPNYENEKDSRVSKQLLSIWRSAISLSVTVFWLSLGIIAGTL